MNYFFYLLIFGLLAILYVIDTSIKYYKKPDFTSLTQLIFSGVIGFAVLFNAVNLFLTGDEMVWRPIDNLMIARLPLLLLISFLSMKVLKGLKNKKLPKYSFLVGYIIFFITAHKFLPFGLKSFLEIGYLVAGLGISLYLTKFIFQKKFYLSLLWLHYLLFFVVMFV